MDITRDGFMYQTDGSAALEVSAAPRLRVIEGGRSERNAFHEASPVAHMHREAVAAMPVGAAPCAHDAAASYDASLDVAPLRDGARVRGFAMALLLSIVLGFGAWAVSHVIAAQSYASLTSNVAEQTVSVMSGDSLLGLAEQHPIAGLDAHQTASWISSRNGLSDALLQPGQSLVVPQ